MLAARREDELAALAAEIKDRGGEASFATTDVSVAKDVERMAAHVIETFGRLDYAVNNAGIEGQFASIVDLPEEEWDRVLDINLKGAFLCLEYEARAMLAGGHGGAIVNVGSINSFLGFPTASAYVTSKHGLIGLTTSVSAELAPQGIRINLICTGVIDTPMHRRLRGLFGDAIYDDVLLQRVHTRRAGRPEEIARSVVFLCSDEASYITGATLTTRRRLHSDNVTWVVGRFHVGSPATKRLLLAFNALMGSASKPRSRIARRDADRTLNWGCLRPRSLFH